MLNCRYSRTSLNILSYTKGTYKQYDVYSFQLGKFIYKLYHFFQDYFIADRLRQHSIVPFSTILSWNTSEQQCQENGGHLVSIADQREMENILSMIKAVPRMVMSIYIGLYREVRKDHRKSINVVQGN